MNTAINVFNFICAHWTEIAATAAWLQHYFPTKTLVNKVASAVANAPPPKQWAGLNK